MMRIKREERSAVCPLDLYVRVFRVMFIVSMLNDHDVHSHNGLLVVTTTNLPL